MRGLVLVAACALIGVACGIEPGGTAARRPAPSAPADASTPALDASMPPVDDDGGASRPDPDASTADTAPPPFSCVGAGKPGKIGDRTITLTSGGIARTILLHVPQGYDPEAGAMLVLNFHGFSSDAAQQILLSKMNDASDAQVSGKRFIVAYPYGVGNGWNAGDCCSDLQVSGPVDDVAFVKALLAQLASEYCIDPRRIYATGMSNGGFMTHRLACEMADTFAAAAPVAGVLGIAPEHCNPKRAVPILHFHGTADGIVPYGGGAPGIDPLKHFRSVQETISIWRQKDACLSGPQTTYAHGDATCVRYTGCEGVADVTLCTIDGGGHAWPGGLAVPTLGKTSTDIRATETMVDFFLAHPMP